MEANSGDSMRTATRMERILFEIKKVIVGQDRFLERVMVALVAGGHLLVEGVPGLAKTLTIKTLARTLSGSFKRIQFTPDLMPADLVGTRIWNRKTGEFTTSLGPVFANLVLADEINRSPAKVQSALLEVMQEHQVTIGGESFPVPEPFLVMATENPIETEGTYALGEAQVDRFMLKVELGYPKSEEEFVIIERALGAQADVMPMATPGELLEMQTQARGVFVDPALIAYAVRLAGATRDPRAAGIEDLDGAILYGVSPRAAIHLVEAGRALAFLRGRDYVLSSDLVDLVPDAFRHRLILSYEALAKGLSQDALLGRILECVAVPEMPMASHERTLA